MKGDFEFEFSLTLGLVFSKTGRFATELLFSVALFVVLTGRVFTFAEETFVFPIGFSFTVKIPPLLVVTGLSVAPVKNIPVD